MDAHADGLLVLCMIGKDVTACLSLRDARLRIDPVLSHRSRVARHGHRRWLVEPRGAVRAHRAHRARGAWTQPDGGRDRNIPRIDFAALSAELLVSG